MVKVERFKLYFYLCVKIEKMGSLLSSNTDTPSATPAKSNAPNANPANSNAPNQTPANPIGGRRRKNKSTRSKKQRKQRSHQSRKH